MTNLNPKPIANFECKYTISYDGKIWNLGTRTYKKPQLVNGYLTIVLILNGRREQWLVHRLVALHFLPNPYGHPIVNHIDGNKANPELSNLEWVDHQGNSQHALSMGLRTGYMSFDDKESYLIRVLAGEKVVTIAQEIGRRQETLSKMLRETADKLGIRDKWDTQMKENRRETAVQNLTTYNKRKR